MSNTYKRLLKSYYETRSKYDFCDRTYKNAVKYYQKLIGKNPPITLMNTTDLRKLEANKIRILKRDRKTAYDDMAKASKNLHDYVWSHKPGSKENYITKSLNEKK